MRALATVNSVDEYWSRVSHKVKSQVKHLIAAEVLGQGCWQFRVSIAPFGALDVTCLQDYTTAILREDREDHNYTVFVQSCPHLPGQSISRPASTLLVDTDKPALVTGRTKVFTTDNPFLTKRDEVFSFLWELQFDGENFQFWDVIDVDVFDDVDQRVSWVECKSAGIFYQVYPWPPLQHAINSRYIIGCYQGFMSGLSDLLTYQ